MKPLTAPRFRRGFTMIELLVSLTGAMFLSISVFMLAKHASALYQREARVASANLASVVGFERLRADIARAGFLASPNVRRDPFVCGNPAADASWPVQLSNLASIHVEDTPSTALPSLFADNDLAPQRIVLAGNYSSSEAFAIRAVLPNGSNYEVYLQVETGPMARLGYSEPEADGKALLESVFPPGRAVRIQDKSGRHHYGTILSVTEGAQPRINLKGDAPTLIFRSGSATGCGLRGDETGALINTVNFIQYSIRSLRADARYAPIYQEQGPAYDANRTELVREELDPSGAVIAGTAELVAEYAVDLRFRVTVAQSASSSLQYIEQANLQDWVGDLDKLGVGRGPQLARSVHAWLSVRSREADREATIPVADGPLFRVGLGESGGAPFARVRTVQSRIALPNQTGVTWQ